MMVSALPVASESPWYAFVPPMLRRFACFDLKPGIWYKVWYNCRPIGLVPLSIRERVKGKRVRIPR